MKGKVDRSTRLRNYRTAHEGNDPTIHPASLHLSILRFSEGSRLQRGSYLMYRSQEPCSLSMDVALSFIGPRQPRSSCQKMREVDKLVVFASCFSICLPSPTSEFAIGPEKLNATTKRGPSRRTAI